MEDVAKGRVNCANLTDEEWALLEKLRKVGGWFIPTEADWMTAAGILALIDIRRGFRPIATDEDSDVIQFGWPHIKINHDGILAVGFHKNGKVYTKGEPSTMLDVYHNRVFITCDGCDGSGYLGDTGGACIDCDGDGYLPY